MTAAARDEDAPPYTLRETIEELRAYDRGQPVCQIETAISALYWLERAPAETRKSDEEQALRQTIGALAAWLENEDSYLPDALMAAALRWLGKVRPTENGGGVMPPERPTSLAESLLGADVEIRSFRIRGTRVYVNAPWMHDGDHHWRVYYGPQEYEWPSKTALCNSFSEALEFARLVAAIYDPPKASAEEATADDDTIGCAQCDAIHDLLWSPTSRLQGSALVGRVRELLREVEAYRAAAKRGGPP